MAPEETPIFKLLKAFKLQQYARKMIDRGFGHEVSKLALLQFTQRQELVTQLRIMPGHVNKMWALFDMVDNLYPS